MVAAAGGHLHYHVAVVKQHSVTDTQLTCYIYMCNMYISDIYIGSYLSYLCKTCAMRPGRGRASIAECEYVNYICQGRTPFTFKTCHDYLFNIPERTMTSNLFSECSCAHHGGTCSAFSVTTTWSCAPCSSIWPSKVRMPLFFAALREPTRLSTCCLHAKNIPPA